MPSLAYVFPTHFGNHQFVRGHTCPSHHQSRKARVSFTMCDRSFWLLPSDKTTLTTGLEANFTHFFFTDKTLLQNCSEVAQFNSTCVDDNNQFPGGIFATIKTPDDVDKLMCQAGHHDIVVIDPKDWTQIPTENLVASYQSSHTQLFAIVGSAEEATTMFSSLQTGVDGCILRTTSMSQIAPFAQLRDEYQNKTAQFLIQGIVKAKVRQIKVVGSGSRVCIDTCNLLHEQEGLWIGSSSQALFLVLSEAATSQYCPSRPFRINSGPVHSYCLLPDGKTKYLSEIRAGDRVLVTKFENDGSYTCRSAVVGRSKIETRPLLMLETVFVDENGAEYSQNLFLQNAETVRVAALTKGKHDMKSVSAVEVGDELILRTDKVARHIGMPIKEDLIEK